MNSSVDVRCRTVASAVMVLSFAIPAVAAETPADTEARNAAAGFAITTSLTLLEALGKQCGTYEDEAGSQARVALQSWQQRNHRYLEPSLHAC